MAIMVKPKKEYYVHLKDQLPKPNQFKIEKYLLLEINPINENIVQENMLLLLNYDLLYLNFNDICCKNYNN